MVVVVGAAAVVGAEGRGGTLEVVESVEDGGGEPEVEDGAIEEGDDFESSFLGLGWIEGFVRGRRGMGSFAWVEGSIE